MYRPDQDLIYGINESSAAITAIITKMWDSVERNNFPHDHKNTRMWCDIISAAHEVLKEVSNDKQ